MSVIFHCQRGSWGPWGLRRLYINSLAQSLKAPASENGVYLKYFDNIFLMKSLTRTFCKKSFDFMDTFFWGTQYENHDSVKNDQKWSKRKEKTDDYSDNYVVASSRPPERWLLERRPLVSIRKLFVFLEIPKICFNLNNTSWHCSVHILKGFTYQLYIVLLFSLSF